MRVCRTCVASYKKASLEFSVKRINPGLIWRSELAAMAKSLSIARAKITML
jgi:hypothetical protein